MISEEVKIFAAHTLRSKVRRSGKHSPEFIRLD